MFRKFFHEHFELVHVSLLDALPQSPEFVQLTTFVPEQVPEFVQPLASTIALNPPLIEPNPPEIL